MSSSIAFILAAGLGTRMKSTLPKVFHPVGGLPMVHHVLNACRTAGVDELSTVIGVEAPENHGLPHPVQQTTRNGTGGAVQVAWQAHLDRGGDPTARAIVLFGDTPLVTADTIERLKSHSSALTVLAFEPDDAAQYGRVLTDATGSPLAIVEFKDADDDQREERLCNAGLMAIDGALLDKGLTSLSTDNAQGELYLTDLVAFAVNAGAPTGLVMADPAEVAGVNSRSQLAEIEGFFQTQKRAKALANAVTLEAPETVFFAHDTALGSDVHVEPNVVFGPGVTVASGARIRAFSHLEGCSVDSGAIIGPYARLRPGADIGEAAKIGNFVEVKNARFEPGAKANHLTYVGDALVGAKANLGAGTITCNYDGYNKARTTIGPGAFIGSNSALVAPVTIGENATIGAGSTITRDVAQDDLAIARGEQIIRIGLAKKLRQKLAARKAATTAAAKTAKT